MAQQMGVPPTVVAEDSQTNELVPPEVSQRGPRKSKIKRDSIESVASQSNIMSIFRSKGGDINNETAMRYLFVTGSMLSNSGKNTAMASIGKKLQDLGYTVTVIKIDNYVNLDFGLLSPIKFGEIFVFNDGTECHYDCGIYERYLNIELTWKHHITLGKILNYVNLNERNGKFYGNVITMKNEQIIDIISQWIYNVAHVPIKKLHTKPEEKNEPQKPNVCIVDFGGFVEDNESDIFLQAMKHFQRYYVDNRDNCYCHIHFSYIIEHAIDSANNRDKKMEVIHQFSETAERILKQELLRRRLIPDICVLRFEGRSRYISNADKYNDSKAHIQQSIIEKFYNLLAYGHASHKFITNKLEEAGMTDDPNFLAVSMEDMLSKVIPLPNLDTMYAIPDYLLHNTLIFESIAEKFQWPEIDKDYAGAAGSFWDVFDALSPRAARQAIKSASVFQELSMKVRTIDKEVTIGLVGKYGTDDLTYLSLIEALKLSALSVNVQLNVKVISSDALETYQEKLEYLKYEPMQGDSSKKGSLNKTEFEKTKFDFMKNAFETPDNKETSGDDVPTPSDDGGSVSVGFSDQEHNEAWRNMYNMDGILVGGGFGSSGILGIVSAIRYCREKNVPFFGICFGMQLACVEYARNVLNLKDANSIEINSGCKSKLVIQMPPDEAEMNKFGHTMRLGSCTVKLKEGSLADTTYNKPENGIIYERHRHGFEINSEFFSKLEQRGLVISGKDEKNKTCEIIELDTQNVWKNHSYFIAAQFHPELIASAYKPAPLFTGLVQACKDRKYGQRTGKSRPVSAVGKSKFRVHN